MADQRLEYRDQRRPTLATSGGQTDIFCISAWHHDGTNESTILAFSAARSNGKAEQLCDAARRKKFTSNEESEETP